MSASGCRQPVDLRNPCRPRRAGLAASRCGVVRSLAIVASIWAVVLGPSVIDAAAETAAGELPRTAITVGGHRFEVEVAATPEHRRRGLMYRRRLPEREGMLFVFPDSDYRAFWMANTVIPLTLAYIDEAGVIFELHELTPFSRTSVPSSRPARYALEVNRGELDELGVGPGDRVGLPPGLPVAR